MNSQTETVGLGPSLVGSRGLRASVSLLPGYLPGLALAGTITACAYVCDAAFGVPLMVTALVLGLAVHELPLGKAYAAGIDFAARPLLRAGVAMLGAGITAQQIAPLGLATVLLAMSGVAATLACGILVAKALGLDRASGLIYGGSVAICGASAAMAISAVLPDTERNRATTAVAVVGVTVLSTIAMVAYPLIATALGMSDHQAGIFFGAAIHDVAQVVGAGYTVSDLAGETATIVKLIRVACLIPVVGGMTWLAARSVGAASEGAGRAMPSILPWFLVGFVVLSAIASSGVVPEAVLDGVSGAAKIMLVTAIAALGCKTSLTALLRIGVRPVLMLVMPTLALMTGILACLLALPDTF
ncbi:YeiH family protein [Alteriqipengyuania lutimaris]|uniref:Putative sulfate exporter family transporter n=1 Tax=Alteriqipengyuania lutimaris TaxID=1538146 RepID=A0A395LLI2_9SPHN|nr:putative sulfate exporter family transporter [Alteriqipengyuania lutimaris]MBB3034874.1 putative integral membrane protein (TIGR00698 family) [Alteriqipengyuania lutimaris]RDS76294.1 putative sulfate exporter family transporter [Alteriqipengyuania lutimaris]